MAEKKGSPVSESSQGDKRRRNNTDENRKQREAIKSAIDKAVEARNSAVEARNSQRAQVSRRDSTDSSSSHDPAPSADSPVEERKKGRKKNSLIWKHCYKKRVNGEDITYCNYCEAVSWKLGGSTSTALYHVRQHHSDKFTEEEICSMNEKSKGTHFTLPTDKLPARAPKSAKLYNTIKHESGRGQELHVKLGLARLSSCTPFNILDNPDWGRFMESLSHYQFYLPSRSYVTSTVIPNIYLACKNAVVEKIKGQPHIALTTDCWKSFAKQSYVTITCHIIDQD